MKSGSPLVAIITGSDSDLPVIQSTSNMLDKLDIPYSITIASAHRSPERVRQWIKDMEIAGVEVFIAGAGGAAHLPGVVAAETIRPVIGVPMPTLYFGGKDSLFSIVQMPAGVPVAAMAVGKSGAGNAAVLAAQILANKYENIALCLQAFKAEMNRDVEKKALELSRTGIDQYIDNM